MVVGSMNSSGNYCAPAVRLTPIYAKRARHQEIYFHFRCQLWQQTFRLFQSNLERQASGPILALWKSLGSKWIKTSNQNQCLFRLYPFSFTGTNITCSVNFTPCLKRQSISKLLVRETDSYHDSIVIVYSDSDNIVIGVSPIVILLR